MWFYMYLLTTSIHIRGGWTMLGKTMNIMGELDHYRSSYNISDHSWNMIAAYNVSMSNPIHPVWEWLSLQGDTSYHDNKGGHWSKLTDSDVEKGLQLFYVNYEKIKIESLQPINSVENHIDIIQKTIRNNRQQGTTIRNRSKLRDEL